MIAKDSQWNKKSQCEKEKSELIKKIANIAVSCRKIELVLSLGCSSIIFLEIQTSHCDMKCSFD